MYYQYKCYIRAADLWRLSMYRTYRSPIGVCNIVFGVSVILLTYRFWNSVGDFVQTLLFMACLIIPVIQPLGVYLKAKAQAAASPQGTELIFKEDGIHVTLGTQHELVPWTRVKNIVREAGMLIVFTDANHGYMLTNRVLGSEKETFYQDVKAQMNTFRK